MKPKEIQKLLGGYATGSLSAEERRALFAAALENQELFNALEEEQTLKELFDDPASREQVRLAAAAGPPATEPPRRHWLRLPERPWVWGAGTALAATAALTIAVLVQWDRPASQVAMAPRSAEVARSITRPAPQAGPQTIQPAMQPEAPATSRQAVRPARAIERTTPPVVQQAGAPATLLQEQRTAKALGESRKLADSSPPRSESNKESNKAEKPAQEVASLQAPEPAPAAVKQRPEDRLEKTDSTTLTTGAARRPTVTAEVAPAAPPAPATKAEVAPAAPPAPATTTGVAPAAAPRPTTKAEVAPAAPPAPATTAEVVPGAAPRPTTKAEVAPAAPSRRATTAEVAPAAPPAPATTAEVAPAAPPRLATTTGVAPAAASRPATTAEVAAAAPSPPAAPASAPRRYAEPPPATTTPPSRSVASPRALEVEMAKKTAEKSRRGVTAGSPVMLTSASLDQPIGYSLARQRGDSWVVVPAGAAFQPGEQVRLTLIPAVSGRLIIEEQDAAAPGWKVVYPPRDEALEVRPYQNYVVPTPISVKANQRLRVNVGSKMIVITIHSAAP